MDAPCPDRAPRDRLAANRARQRELYGEPLGERVRRLTAGLGITQVRLAAALGLSPAMLSQLAGARRVKIGDPAVLGRMLSLDRRLARGAVPSGEVAALLDEVRTAPTPWGPEGACRCGAGPAAVGPPVPSGALPTGTGSVATGSSVAVPAGVGPSGGVSSGAGAPMSGPAVSGSVRSGPAMSVSSGAGSPGAGSSPLGARPPGSPVAVSPARARTRPALRPAPTADDALRTVTAPARLVAAAAALAPSFPEIAEVLRRAASRR
ncbi:hypothetical protein SAMN05216207_1002242 [Pseudonocardia ammonioxydans]|uniref:Helix-turn-helix domain-containing protein n=1 Tax=Pseudonocardia ammonioxydans TaxID=260086 RepID=A0A1I4TE20_PSUAM|nr:helix-turn-helix domain-containing protein [Pseudonocardia ammonioxydans]SFM74817.1 hypothetical protein SAMN05216207_1002242 [Pseudonocardia ammonioxydans]